MGNSFGGKRSVKIMKTTGETFKLKTPAQAGSVLANHPGHVLLASEAVVRNGARAKPLEPNEELKPRCLYFLVDLPKLPEARGVNNMLRRVRSGVHMTARDRLESLKLARRSASDLSAANTVVSIEERGGAAESGGGGGVRVRLRLSKAEVERLMAESKDGADVAEKIVGLYMSGGGASSAADTAEAKRNVHWNGDRGLARQSTKSREKRVGFLPIDEGEIHLLESHSVTL